MSPSLLTTMLTLSGFVWIAWLVSSGRVIFCSLSTTGLVIRKMISRTNMMSTRGVVLISDITWSSPPLSEPTDIDMVLAYFFGCAGSGVSGGHGAGDQHRVHVSREGTHFFHRGLVKTNQPVVTQNGRNSDCQTECRHDQCFTDRTCNLVDRRVTGHTDVGQCTVNTPDGTEQTDERCGRADGCQERQAILQTGLDFIDSALDRHRHPGRQVNLFQQGAVVVTGSLDAGFGDEAEWRAFSQRGRTGGNRRCFPELGVHVFCLAHDLHLVQQLGDDDVPGADRHDRHDDDGTAWHPARFPHSLDAERVFDFFLASGGAVATCCCVGCRGGGGVSWCCCWCCGRIRCWRGCRSVSGCRGWRVGQGRCAHQGGCCGHREQHSGQYSGQTGILKHASSKLIKDQFAERNANEIAN